MTSTPPISAPAPEARAGRSLWPGLVWAIPLAALLIVAVLGLRAFSDRGIDVVVTFRAQGGVRVGDTKVVYQGYEVGRVVKIAVSKNAKTVDLTLQMDRRTHDGLNSSAIFWMIGAKPNISDISSLKAAFTGVAIGVAPGFTGAPTRHFKGLDDVPVITPDTPGAPYVLKGQQLGSVRRGSTLVYSGQEIGKVTGVTLTRPGAFSIDVFVVKPFDSLIRPGDLFWNSAPLKLSMTGAGVEARIDNAATVLTGSIDLAIPESAMAAPSSPAGASFPMYASQHEALLGPPGVQEPYTLTFAGDGGTLTEGASVVLLGFQVGEVKSRTLAFNDAGTPMTSVVAVLDPKKLGAAGMSRLTDPAVARAASDAAVNRLLAQGYRAKLSQSPPFVGGRVISLERVRGARRGAGLIPGEPPGIPTMTASGDIDDLTSQASQILAKVNSIPIEQIGQNVRGITARLNTLISSPKVSDSLSHLDSTLAQVDAMMAQARPQVGPLMTKLNQAVDQASDAAAAAKGVLAGQGPNPDASLPVAIEQLSDAARSIRALADYLGRHPEALVRGKGKEAK